MKIIAWKEPPPAPAGVPARSADLIEIARELRKRRGMWAYVGIRSSSSFAYAVNAGKQLAFRPKGAFEGRAAKTEDGDYDIFIRFIGNPKPEDA